MSEPFDQLLTILSSQDRTDLLLNLREKLVLNVASGGTGDPWVFVLQQQVNPDVSNGLTYFGQVLSTPVTLPEIPQLFIVDRIESIPELRFVFLERQTEDWRGRLLDLMSDFHRSYKGNFKLLSLILDVHMVLEGKRFGQTLFNNLCFGAFTLFLSNSHNQENTS